MKSTGIIRSLDELGRITIPKELRNSFNIGDRSPIEIFTDGDHICLKKRISRVCSCGEIMGLKEWNGGYICEECITKLYNGVIEKRNNHKLINPMTRNYETIQDDNIRP